MAADALSALPLSPLAVPPHRLEDLFWERLLPVLVVLLAAGLAAALGRLVPLKAEEATERGQGQAWARLLRALVHGLVFLGCLAAAVSMDRVLHGDPRGLDMVERFGAAVVALWAGFLGLDLVMGRLRAGFLAGGRVSAAAVLPLLRKIGKAAWAMLIVVLFLENLGLDMKALLAGLGVGGLAIALAGQKTMENLFGGVVLVLDQPVRVGDFCRFGDHLGTVEDVGLRSIKIRTPDRTLITVPNGEFSQLQLENFARRDRIRFQAVLGLRYDATAAQLRQALAGIQALLEAHAHLDPLMVRRARLVELGSYAVNVEVFAYFKTADQEQFLLWQQELLLDLMEQVERAGTGLAFPTQTQVVEAASTKA
jgi:MscS family membrane protein